MATLALSVAGQFAGGIVGGPFGATLGRALGALAGSAIDNELFGKQEQASLPTPFALQGSSEGGAIPRIYGWNRVTGNIIWATNLERQTTQNSGSKGIFENQEEQIVANFAIGLCEGEVARLGRIWADGRLLDTQGLNLRFYSGSQTQDADSLISTKQGVDNTPAYRGMCYLVFEGLSLAEFGNRIPNISVELCRVIGDLEPAIKAITIIPGSTEFGYDPMPRVRIVSPGNTAAENTNLLGQISDWTLSLDELQALCPNLKHVALVISWFGDDLQCETCKIQPRVENDTKVVSGTQWTVSGTARQNVPMVSQYEGGPAYGGTPSDSSVLAAIADLNTRGIKVTLYPFVLMDIDHANVLTDPYSGLSGQAAYPWRGRITCSPAPGEASSPDKTAAASTQVDAFVGTATPADFSVGTQTINYSGAPDWGYRRMVLHYANLTVLAGGVDAMLIGSELRGLTQIRSDATSFPFVDALVTLAADVRSIVGPTTKLSYGADWSEYSGLQPSDAPGDKLFNLDPLWASSDIDAIGIDNYMPVSDWRGSGNEPDASIAQHPHQLSYLQANIAGGEGFDWYYGSASDREAGTRTMITDGADAEPWVWRFKDIKSWWSNAHHNRVDGIRQSTATNWVPQSKPIWFTELGCGAVDKGANQPNVFGDAKSAENAKPYFSDGSPDPQMQRQFLRAHHQFWQSGSPQYVSANNPDSSVYTGQMLDPERIYVWTWDARPYPAFPMRTDVWSDGTNHQTGHWLTGRLSAIGAEEFISALFEDYGISVNSVTSNKLNIEGAQISDIVSLRAAMEPFLAATGLQVRDSADGLNIFRPSDFAEFELSASRLATGSGPILTQHAPNHDEAVGQLSLGYIDRALDYQASSVIAMDGKSPIKTSVATNLVLQGTSARGAVQTIFTNKDIGTSLEFNLPYSEVSVEVGDTFKLDELGEKRFVVSGVQAGETLTVSATAEVEYNTATLLADEKSVSGRAPQISALPQLFAAHMPGKGTDVDGTHLLLGAHAQPWPGNISIVTNPDDGQFATLTQNAILGVLSADFGPSTSSLWDRNNVVDVEIYSGHLSSISELEALNGVNKLAIVKPDGQCEIIGFATAALLEPGKYRLSNLLRGQNGSFVAANYIAISGSEVMLINDAARFIPISNAQLEYNLSATVYAGGADLVGQPLDFEFSQNLAKPFAPAHVSAKRIGTSNDISFSWHRRGQVGSDSWIGADIPLDYSPESYSVNIFDGGSLVRKIYSSVPQAVYLSADQVSDFGSVLPSFEFEILQLSAVHGEGSATSGNFAA